MGRAGALVFFDPSIKTHVSVPPLTDRKLYLGMPFLFFICKFSMRTEYLLFSHFQRLRVEALDTAKAYWYPLTYKVAMLDF